MIPPIVISVIGPDGLETVVADVAHGPARIRMTIDCIDSEGKTISTVVQVTGTMVTDKHNRQGDIA